MMNFGRFLCVKTYLERHVLLFKESSAVAISNNDSDSVLLLVNPLYCSELLQI